MGTHKLAGFTIIEVMLFFSISGLLIVTLIVGAGANLNTQRYRDAAESFKSLLQQQYADLTSVKNSRDNTWSCGVDALPVDSSAGQSRGQSDCVLIGKYVRVEDSTINIYNVTGYKANSLVQPDDISDLKNNYLLNISATEAIDTSLEWGTRIASPVTINGSPNPSPASPRKLGMLVVRSPESGQIYTFTNKDSNVPDVESVGSVSLGNMLVGGNTVPGQGSQVVCIDSDGLFTTNDRSVFINSYASSASSIELRTNDFMRSSVAPGSETQC